MLSDECLERCQVCDIAPDARQIFQCSNKHIMCILCGLKSGRICIRCNSDTAVVSNPLINCYPDGDTGINSKSCPFTKNGCTWGFKTLTESQEHAKECKYRPYLCLGNIFKIWNCDWKGTQESFEEHAKQAHPHLRETFAYWHNGSVSFSNRQTTRMLKLINAFNKKFIFFYNSNGESDELTFAIFLIGRKCDADRYLIDFEVRQDQRKIKFLEKCHSDADDIFELIRTGHCFTMSKKIIESLVTNGKINFRFIIKRKDAVTMENVIKDEYLKNRLLVNAKENQPQTVESKSTDWRNTDLLAANAIKLEPQTSRNEYFSENKRDDYELLDRNEEVTSKPTTKVDVSAIADIVQSFNLKRNTETNNQPPQLPSNMFNPRFEGKFMKKKFPTKSNGPVAISNSNRFPRK